MKYVIVGNSFAGIFAVEALRSVDHAGEIVIIGDEAERSYSRAMMHEYLAGMVDESKIYLREEGFYERLNVALLSGKRASELRANNREVLADDETVSYDKLLIAVGGAPFVPPGIEGLGEYKESVFTFTRLGDIHRLARPIGDVKKVVVLGAGLIGMQAA